MKDACNGRVATIRHIGEPVPPGLHPAPALADQAGIGAGRGKVLVGRARDGRGGILNRGGEVSDRLRVFKALVVQAQIGDLLARGWA